MTIRRTTLISGVAIFVIVLLAACQPIKPTSYQANQQAGLNANQQVGQSANQELLLSGSSPAVDIAVSNQDQNGQPLQQRVVLKDASLQILVEDVATTLDAIAKMADTMGGWVINSSTTKASQASGDDAVTGSIAIRVPAAQLDAALTQIKGQATSVDSENITGKDVTQEYTDLNSQLTNLKAAEKQLQTILDSASTTDDVLKIYNELVRVRGEIETTQGRINYYKEAANFSSISVVLRPPTIAREAVEVDTGWSPGTTVKGAFNALVNILQAVANLIIILVVLVLPLILVIGIPVWLIYKLLRRFGWINTRPRPTAISKSPSNTQVENDVG